MVRRLRAAPPNILLNGLPLPLAPRRRFIHCQRSAPTASCRAAVLVIVRSAAAAPCRAAVFLIEPSAATAS